LQFAAAPGAKLNRTARPSISSLGYHRRMLGGSTRSSLALGAVGNVDKAAELVRAHVDTDLKTPTSRTL
jgi:hypothetical protein